MDVFVFVVLIVAIGCGTGIVTTYLENKGTFSKGVAKDEFASMNAKLDNIIARVETLERLATDDEQSLRRDFRDIEKSA